MLPDLEFASFSELMTNTSTDPQKSKSATFVRLSQKTFIQRTEIGWFVMIGEVVVRYYGGYLYCYLTLLLKYQISGRDHTN